MRAVGLALGLLLLLGACVPGKVTYGETEALPLVHPSSDRRRWYAVVDAGERGEHLFFFDSGYSVTTCDDDFAEALDMRLRGTTRVRGEAGLLVARRSRLIDVDIGGHVIERLPCLVRDLGSTSSIRDPLEVPVAGVLGADLLSHFHVVVDPARATLTLHPPGARTLDPKAEGVVRMRRERPFSVRRTMPIEVAGARLHPVVDTGASVSHLDVEALGLEPTRVRQGAVVRASGSEGRVVRDISIYEVDVHVAGYTVERVSVSGRAGSPWDDGLLGLDVLGGFRQEYAWRRGLAWLVPSEADIPTWRGFKQAQRALEEAEGAQPAEGEGAQPEEGR